MEKRLDSLVAIKVTAAHPRSEAKDTKQTTRLYLWLEEALKGTNLLMKLESLLLRAQSKLHPGAVLGLSLLLAIGVSMLTYVLTWMLTAAIAAGVCAGYLPILMLQIQARRRLAAFDAVLADCIEMCARALRAGHSLTSAIGMVADDAPEPAKTEFTEIFRKQSYGLGLRDALMESLQRMPSTDLQVVITGMLVQKETGGNLVEIMERLASLIRDRARIQREVRTHTAQGRMTGWILCMLPVILLVIINLLDPGYSRVLFQTDSGKKLLSIGIVLLAMGAFTIRRIVRGIEV
ncbi:MAG: type II secretion system F family protein [Acidobacteriaceae bacterium]|nr:type II secretion system F family protein [Acidobacteriaceae bacterium]